MYNAYKLGKVLGVPYVPFTPYGAAIPLPVKLRVHYGEPIVFEGTGREDDEVIARYVAKVKTRVAELMEEGRKAS